MSTNSLSFLGTIAGAVLPVGIVTYVATKSGDSLSARMRKIIASIPTCLTLARHGGDYIARTPFWRSNDFVKSECLGLLMGAAFAAQLIRSSSNWEGSVLTGLLAPSFVSIGRHVNRQMIWLPLKSLKKGREYSYKQAVERVWEVIKYNLRSAPSQFPTSESWIYAEKTYRDLPKALERLRKYGA